MTSRPLRGAEQVAAIEPSSVQAVRPMRSVQTWSTARLMISRLLRMSAMAKGVSDNPLIAKLAIWASGKARPMVSASTMGISISAPTSNGSIAFSLPISMVMAASKRRPV